MRSEDTPMERIPNPEVNSLENEPDYWIKSQIGDKKLEDEYLLGDVIGRGASSVVYKCLRKGRTEWACKILKKSQLNKKAIQSEILNLLKLKHPNIVQIKEVFETHNEIQLILELAPGGELFERIVERGHYSEEIAAQAVRDILSALQYLHKNGIVHKDLKPENLLYQTEMEDSILKLTDFGMHKLLSEEHELLSRACGTNGYDAPEVLLNKEYDSSIDLWSLGVVTYIMLCGFEPFLDEGGEAATTKRIIEGDYSFPSPWWDEISDSAKELISKLLSVDPKLRPTAEQALNHPWTLGISTFSLHMNETIIRLREFNAKRRFRVATKAVLATRRALNLLSPGRKSQKDNNKVDKSKCLYKSPVDVGADECTGKLNGEKVTDCSSTDNAPSRVGKTVDNSLTLMGTDGEQIGKNQSKLSTEFTAQYKENYVGLG